MKKHRIILPLILGMCLFAQTSLADKAYVTDSIQITLRSGPSIDNKIIKFLTSGKAVDVLENQGEWSRVRLIESDQEEKEGWVMNRYLITRLPWEAEAISLRNENEKLKTKLDRIEKEWTDLKNNALDYDKLQKQYETLKQESADFLNVKAEYDVTLAKLETTRLNLQALNIEYESLMSSQRNKWFATGAIVLLFGLLIGLVAGRQQKRRKTIY